MNIIKKIFFLLTIMLVGCGEQQDDVIETQYNAEWSGTLDKLGIKELHVCEGNNGSSFFSGRKQYSVIIQENYWCMFRGNYFAEIPVSEAEFEHYDGITINKNGTRFEIDYDSDIKEVYYPEELSLFLTEITKAYTEKKADIISRRSSKKETLAEAWKKVEN